MSFVERGRLCIRLVSSTRGGRAITSLEISILQVNNALLTYSKRAFSGTLVHVGLLKTEVSSQLRTLLNNDGFRVRWSGKLINLLIWLFSVPIEVSKSLYTISSLIRTRMNACSVINVSGLFEKFKLTEKIQIVLVVGKEMSWKERKYVFVIIFFNYLSNFSPKCFKMSPMAHSQNFNTVVDYRRSAMVCIKGKFEHFSHNESSFLMLGICKSSKFVVDLRIGTAWESENIIISTYLNTAIWSRSQRLPQMWNPEHTAEHFERFSDASVPDPKTLFSGWNFISVKNWNAPRIVDSRYGRIRSFQNIPCIDSILWLEPKGNNCSKHWIHDQTRTSSWR